MRGKAYWLLLWSRCFYPERDEVGLLCPYHSITKAAGQAPVETDLPCPVPGDVSGALHRPRATSPGAGPLDL